MRRSSLPVSVRGSSSRSQKRSGVLLDRSARMSEVAQLGRVEVGLRAGTTAASMRWPHSWSGTPNTTASSTAGCLSRTSSISAGAMFSAPG